MGAAVVFGYALIAASAALLASHWNQWREAAALPPSQRLQAAYLRLQVGRRAVASGLIGVVGAALTLVNYVPRDPTAITAYLAALLAAGFVILLIALADLRAGRGLRRREELDLLVAELRKLHPPE